MKTRTGFVSNSSSSSFILQFTKEINGKDDLISFLGSSKMDTVVINDYDETPDTVSAGAIADYLFATMDKTRMTPEAILQMMKDEFDEYTIEDEDLREKYSTALSFSWYGYQETIKPVLDLYKLHSTIEAASLPEDLKKCFQVDYSNAQINYYTKKAECEKFVVDVREQYVPARFKEVYDPTKFYYQAEFEDHDRIGSWLEHDGIENLKVARFSHH